MLDAKDLRLIGKKYKSLKKQKKKNLFIYIHTFFFSTRMCDDYPFDTGFVFLLVSTRFASTLADVFLCMSGNRKVWL